MQASLFAMLGLLLLVAIGLVAYGSSRPVIRTFHGKLVDMLPEAPPGWTRTLRTIADTPEMQRAVGELLRFDDGVFVDYTRGAERLSVYIAYWTPGKMSHRLVAGHTPDVCWVAAGWRCEERSTVNPHMSAFSSSHLSFPPAEARTFTAGSMVEYVWFWHMVGSQAKSYDTGTEPPWHASITDMLDKGLDQREEQFFIRLSSPQPLDRLALAPPLEAILQRLPLHQSKREDLGP